MRAPLEKAELVEQGALTAQSNLAMRWNNKLSASDSDALVKVIEALSEFQKKFDLMIEELRTNYIQIRSSTKPDGLFSVGMQKLGWDAFHSDWEGAETFDKFFDSVWDAFLITLNNGLDAVKNRLNIDVLNRSEQLFLELRASLDSVDLAPVDRPILVAAINNGTTSFQDAIRVVTQWFTYKDDSLDVTNINFDQLVELALNVFRNARPALSVTVKINSEPTHLLFGGVIVPKLIDAFFIVLDNVYQHSGLKTSASIELDARWEEFTEGKGALVMEFMNSLADSVDKQEVIKKFEEVRNLLSTGGNEERLNSEGGSGLIKLARIAKHQNHLYEHPLNFELTEDKKVKVVVRIALSYRESALLGE